jgi:hypothetical protein
MRRDHSWAPLDRCAAEPDRGEALRSRQVRAGASGGNACHQGEGVSICGKSCLGGLLEPVIPAGSDAAGTGPAALTRI